MSGALDRELRRELAKAVRVARETAEAGARSALGALMVGKAEADPSLSGAERALRRRLRAHGRQLGDCRRGKEQEVERLAREVAYEHWHRMLFARFLTENGFLIEPEYEAAVSLDDCRELAREKGEDPWTLAGRFAAAMLPQIFRPDDPSLAVKLPPETRQALEKTLAGLPPAVFAADDAFGWSYQYWQADRKDEVNRSGVKIGADELPAVTQLFTEPYMVRFLFHNTVGAWRAGRILADRPELANSAGSEAELRQVVRLEAKDGYDFDYLRFVRDPSEAENGTSGRWRPASGSFEKWPVRAAELRVLDPCCGSGHFLVEALHLLVRLRMEEENLPLEDAIRAVLSDNLHGMEIDPRCAQIAAFSVAFAAWRLAEGFIKLPPLRIACSGLAPNATQKEWLTLAERATGAAGSVPDKGLGRTQDTNISDDLRNTLKTLHDLFSRAPTLGSLIDPHWVGKSLFAAKFDKVRPLLYTVLKAEETDPEHRERTVAAAGMAEAASLLVGTYSLVITNVPYLGRGRQEASLRESGKAWFPASKGDLATMFVERGFGWTGEAGTEAFVVPQNWLYQTTYRRLREDLLRQRQWRFVTRLGPGAFETISGHVVNVALIVVSAQEPDDGWQMAGLDVSQPRTKTSTIAREKANLLPSAAVNLVCQADQWRNPDSAVLHRPFGEGAWLSGTTDAHQGIATADYTCFGRKFWEFPGLGSSWEFHQTTVKKTTEFGGREHILHWEEGEGSINTAKAYIYRGGGVWNKQGIAVSQIGSLPVTRYTGELFDNNVSALGPLCDSELAAVWCFCSSPEYAKSVREIDQKLNVTNATLVKIPFDLERWKAVAAKEYPNGLPEPYSDDPTQSIFHGHPCGGRAELTPVVFAGKKVRTPSRDALADGLAAFANSRGGVLVLGVHDRSREIVGIPRERLDEVVTFVGETVCERIEPPPDVVVERMEVPDTGGRLRCVVRVAAPRGPFVHRSPGGYLRRAAGKNRQMTSEALQRLLQQRSDSGAFRFEHEVVASASFADLDPALVRRFRPVSANDDEQTLAIKLGMARRHDDGEVRPTVAGLLLGARDATHRRLPNAFIRAAAYRGRSVGNEREDGNYRIAAQDIRGPLDVQVAKACRFVVRNQTVAAEGATGRGGKPQYDPTAVFEAVVNAVAHRDYSLYEPKIRLRMFSDRLELDAPGELSGTMTVDALEYRQTDRNPTVAGLLTKCPVPPGMPGLDPARTTLVDRRGEGVGLILGRSEAHSGRKPEYELLDTGELRLTIHGANEADER